MYSFRDIVKGLKKPQLALRELNRLYYTKGRKTYNKNGVDIFEEEWDNFVILDAARYDMFESQVDIEGDLQSRISRGSSTVEFLRGNFDGRELKDTIYVTANPQLEWNRDQIRVEFFKVENLWNRDEYWDDEYSTVRPEKVTERALELAEKYPDKRLIVHYMQPHYPFLPSNSEDVEEMKLSDHFWHMKMRGKSDTDKEQIWEMYRGNLDVAVPEVKRLLGGIKGLTVVTSDHGNFVGENSSPIPVREWGHPIGIYDETLVKVPWLVIEGDRREITSGETGNHNKDINEEEVKEKLAGLGYGG